MISWNKGDEVVRTQDEIMYRLWKSKKYGWTQTQIAELFGCDVATICRRINPERWKRWEIVMSPQKLKELYEELGSVEKVADALWCGSTTIRRKLKRYSIPVRRRGKPPLGKNMAVYGK